MAKRSRFFYTTILFVCILIFFGCDSYHSRKKLATELSSLYNDNLSEFQTIQQYFMSDSLSKRFNFSYRDNKIEIDDGSNQIIIDSINQIKNNMDVYGILIFMKKNKIRIISSNAREGWITFAFKDHKFPCFNFWYRSDFNPDDEYVKQEVENIKNTKTKKWIYILGGGWYIRGVKCF